MLLHGPELPCQHELDSRYVQQVKKHTGLYIAETGSKSMSVCDSLCLVLNLTQSSLSRINHVHVEH